MSDVTENPGSGQDDPATQPDPMPPRPTPPAGVPQQPPGLHPDDAAGGSQAAGASPGLPGAPPSQEPSSWAGWAPPASSRGLAQHRLNPSLGWIVAGVLALAVVGLAVALGTTGGSAPARASSPSIGPRQPVVPAPGFFGPAGGGGVVGTVASVGFGTFTVTALSGQSVTVDEQSSTTYYVGSTSASPSAVGTGDRVLVQGSRSGTVVKATRVILLGSGAFGSGFGPR